MKLKILASAIILPIIAVTLVQVNMTQSHLEEDTFTPCGHDEAVHYAELSTELIQIEVEKHSELGDYPFALGQELIKRWSQG